MLKLALFLSFSAFVASSAVLYKTVREDYAMYQREGKCIQVLIQQGYARSEINTYEGVCWAIEK